MTMIAFTVRPDRVDIVTDGLSYDEKLMSLGYVSKAMPLANLDMALMTQGPCELGLWWRKLLEEVSAHLGSFDDVDEIARQGLPQVWDQIEHKPDEDAAVFHVGWSPARRRMVAYAYGPSDGWERVDLTEHQLFSKPVPVSMPRVPETDEQWRAFVEALYDEHALSPIALRMKVPLGGGVQHTRLERGSFHQRRLFTLPKDGWRFRKMLIGSLHPDGQLGPCPCGSATPYALCHLGRLIDGPAGKPCPCRSGRVFDDCCLVDLQGPRAAAFYRNNRADYRRTAAELRTAWEQAVRADSRKQTAPPVVQQAHEDHCPRDEAAAATQLA